MRYLKTQFLLRSATAMVVTAALVVPANAQQLEEVVVTAQKRDETLLEVPVAVSLCPVRILSEPRFATS